MNWSGDLDMGSSYWDLMLLDEIRLLVGLRGGGSGWSSGVGTWVRLEVGVRLIDFKLLVGAERVGLNSSGCCYRKRLG